MKGPWRKTDVWHLVVGSVSLRRGQETIGEGAAWGDPTVSEILGLWNDHEGQQQPWSRDGLSHEECVLQMGRTRETVLPKLSGTQNGSQTFIKHWISYNC